MLPSAVPIRYDTMQTMNETQRNRISLNKFEVARRQLETAIAMYFNGGDVVSAHTLATAALEVLRGLNNALKGSPMVSDLEASGIIRPDKLEDARRAVRGAQNFFKHADKDPTGTLDFNPDTTAFYILDGVEKYRELSRQNPPVMRVFALWFRVQWPEAFHFAGGEEAFLNITRSFYSLNDKAKFFAEFLPRYAAEEPKMQSA
ncbi:MAG: hypothetical protein JWR26_4319 [Pedosphaera sp.]|nr:hypothetical protein [Pedosphaera sp.]